MSNGFPLHGVVQFEAGWRARFVHFDTTADLSLTPHGRWRGTLRTHVEPWLAQCERDLPGEAVRNVEVRWHWQARVFVTLLLCSFGAFAAQRWADLAGWQKFGAFAALTFGAVAFWRLIDIERGASREMVAIRLPDKKPAVLPGSSPTPEDPAVRHHAVAQTMTHWPGRRGLGYSVMRSYYDEDLQPTEPAYRWSLRTPTISKPLTEVVEHRVPGGFFLYGRMVEIVQIDRDIDRTTRQFADRALLHGVNAFGATLASAISFVWSWTDSRMLTLIPFCLPADDWRTALTAALPHCERVIIPATGTAPDTIWQLTEAMRLLPPSRLLLLLPPTAKEYARFRKAAHCHLPELPVPRGQWNPALRGVVHFADDWTPTIRRFSAAGSGVPRTTQLTQLRAELEPILGHPPKIDHAAERHRT